MTLFKIKNPVEFSFHIWMNNYPDSTHWADKARFYSFVKTVCRYNASKWKDQQYLKKRILDRLPHFDPRYLEHLLELFEDLIEFHKTRPLLAYGSTPDGESTVDSGNYIEKGIKDGRIYEKVLPLKN